MIFKTIYKENEKYELKELPGADSNCQQNVINSINNKLAIEPNINLDKDNKYSSM